MAFSTSAKSRLTRHDLDRFPGKSLFDRIARAVCEAGCLPRKELYEAWEVARRVRRRIRARQQCFERRARRPRLALLHPRVRLVGASRRVPAPEPEMPDEEVSCPRAPVIVVAPVLEGKIDVAPVQ